MLKRREMMTWMLAAGVGTAVQAQSNYPSKPIRIMVPFGAGGIADLTARAVGERLAVRLGQSVVIENRPSAGGIVAGEAVAKAEPDGHTLLLMSNGTAVSAGLFKSLPFNPRTDFAPISLLGLFDMAVVVPENSPHKSMVELMAYAKSNPGKLNIGTINIGSTQNLAAELMRSQANMDAQIVPFNGTPALLNALRGGQIDLAVEILGPLKPQISAKAVRLLAVMGEQRPADLPDTPTLKELPQMGGLVVSSWNALAAPAKTPKPIIDRLASEVSQVLADPELIKRLAGLQVMAKSSSPAQLGQLLDRDIVRWSEVIKKAGIPLQ
ncbi:MAG: tripartite tricarboxylate transporter substrate binding protein [Betaproteobacteria bacterium]|jgi:tripartite-type tricarboxylate transporter receptor subunit TctC|nr:tripartite tricarboxylate transporter substrate binding protein [Betaproteobacteria bacterium]NBP44032.1 tripartite tricarboxylate transporter substrate binding protein [Betaproteobacteria bacterium]